MPARQPGSGKAKDFFAKKKIYADPEQSNRRVIFVLACVERAKVSVESSLWGLGLRYVPFPSERMQLIRVPNSQRSVGMFYRTSGLTRPAAAVIPAPIAYIKVVAVKKLVVEVWSRALGLLHCMNSATRDFLPGEQVGFALLGNQEHYFEKIRVFKAGQWPEYISME